MWFFDGPGNDVVEVCVDGNRCTSGGSWEDRYRDIESTDPRPVDTVSFGDDGPAAPGTEGNGFFIDRLVTKAVTHSGAPLSVSGPIDVVEGDSGDVTVPYTISLSEPLPITVRVPYHTSGVTADASDLTPTSGTAVLAPGQTSTTVDVTLHGDTVDETHETFTMNLGTPQTTGRGSGTASGQYVFDHVSKTTTTILDDDSMLRVDDASVTEPAFGTATVPFTVSLANASAIPVTVHLTTADGTAVAPADYSARSDVDLSFSAGATSKVVNVTVKADDLVEGDERFTVNLHDPTNAVIADATGSAVIHNSDHGPRPNIVVVETDDQTLEQMRFMPHTQALLGDQGTTFTNSFVNYPLCCPSRATFLTGQYSHNDGVRGNDAPDGGYSALDHTNTLPVWLQRSGYATALVGKYLNGYGVANPHARPAGWTDWNALVGNTVFSMYDYQMNRNGTLVDYGSEPADYQTDVLSAQAVGVIERHAPDTAPFFLWVTPAVPHWEGDGSLTIRPAPRHADLYDTLPLPKPPNFNEADVSDKPPKVSSLPLLSPGEIDHITRSYRNEVEALQAVDEMVEDIYQALQESGELDNTVFVFTNDNGVFHGEHRINAGKGREYDEDTRVPLIVRGPGFAAGKRATEPVINADLAPTFVELANAKPGRVMDGRSLLHPLRTRPLLFETLHNAVQFTAVRTPQWLWVEYASGGRELFDVVNDPYQLSSLAKDLTLADTRTQLAELLAELRTCAGSTCRSP
jgi:arylsulfatase A-like enzyme